MDAEPDRSDSPSRDWAIGLAEFLAFQLPTGEPPEPGDPKATESVLSMAAREREHVMALGEQFFDALRPISDS